MSTSVTTRSRTNRSRAAIPAYGPVDAVIGYVVFYIFVDRATPTVVDVATTAVPDVTSSLVRLGLAAVLWFILGVTIIDQVRRQLAALGVGSRVDVRRAERSRVVPTEPQVFGYLAILLLGGTIAAWTFETAIQTGITFIRIVGTTDVALFVPLDFITMIAFFVSFASATRALDRLLIGGIRRLMIDKELT